LATNMFVQFSNLPGECEATGHTDWCEITSLKQGFSNEAAPLPPGETDQSDSRRGTHKAIEIEKVIDKASIGLMDACWTGAAVADVVIECFRAGTGSSADQPIKYFSIELKNVIIKSLKYEVDEGKLVAETLELVAAQASYEYWQMDKRDGTATRAGTATITLGQGDHDDSPNRMDDDDDDGDDDDDDDDNGSGRARKKRAGVRSPAPLISRRRP